MSTTIKKIPLHDIHERLGAKMIPYAGFYMPIWYSSSADEHRSVRKKVGIFDVSHMGEFVLKGSKALDLIQRITSNDASKLICGQAQYSYFPSATGGVVDDLIVYKIHEEEYLLVVNAGNINKDWEWILQHNTHEVPMEDRSDNTCLFAIQGPKARTVLQKLTTADLSAVKYYHFTIGTLAGKSNVLMSNTGYTGSGGFEVYIDKKDAPAVWNALLEAGRAEKMVPVGLGARDTLRLEKGYCLYGNDIDDDTSPLEAGLGWVTKFNKHFTYSDKLKQQQQEGLKRKLVAFKMIEKGIPRHGYDITNKQHQHIGKVTSGALSPILNTGIGMGYVAIGHAAPDSPIYISVREKLLSAHVQRLPLV